MAAAYIPITTATNRAQQLLQYLRLLAQAQALGIQEAAIITAMVNGADYTLVESMFGLQAGQGQSLYNLVTGANAAVNVSAVTQLISDVG